MRWGAILFLFFAIAPALGTSAVAEPTEQEWALQTLQSIRTDLDLIRKTGLHELDEGRLILLDKEADAVTRVIGVFGLASMATMNEYYNLLVKFRYSSQFFEFIRTPHTEETIRHLLATVQAIRDKLKIDEQPFTLLKPTEEQMVAAMNALLRLDAVDNATRSALIAMRPALGEAISVAALGDRTKAFAAATIVFHKVRAIYPALESISSSAARNLAIEILGLNEFIKEYAQIPD